MSLTPAQQFQELLKKTKAPLILLPAYPSRDTLASAFALAFFLEKAGITPTVAGDNIQKNKGEMAFLGEPTTLLASISGARDFVLSFNTERNQIMNVRTEKLDQEIRIYLTPAQSSIDPRDFSFIPAQFKFDLALVIGAPDKESLGKIYEENPDIFYEIPIVNIDNHSNNELFGQVNLVDITASSTAEILAENLEKAAPSHVTDQVSESLLAGIISATESFQKKNTTPKALHVASMLMDKGADQQKIVQALFKTQPLHLLKLWGRVMAGVKWNENLKLIWANVSLEDLVQSRAKSEDLPQVLEKIRNNYASASLFMILFPETSSLVRGMIKGTTPENLTPLIERFPDAEMQGETLTFSLPAHTLEEAELAVIQKLGQTPSQLPT